MDYEKAYKEALERAREFQKSKDGLCVLTAESIFPELKESEDEKIRKALVGFHKSTIDVDGIKGEEIVSWLEKQGEKKSIMNVPSREVILSIWDLGNEWKELTNGSISTEYGTQLDYIQKHWHESEYYLRAKQDEKKVTTIDFNAKDWYVSKVDGKIHDMIEDKDAFTNPGEFENSLGRLLKLFEKLPKQDLLDGLKFYTNVVEHDGKYVKPTEWNNEDERMCQETIDWFEKKCFPYALEHENQARESIRWLKSLKQRING